MLNLTTSSLLLLATLAMPPLQRAKAQSARDYFNELQKAGSLDSSANEYVCFDDKADAQGFFIYADYSTLKKRLSENGELAKLPQSQKHLVDRGFIIVREYFKGVPHADEDVYLKDESTWVTEPFKLHSQDPSMLMRLNIAPGTSRYERTVEILNSAMKVENRVSHYGRCETIASN